MTEPSKPVELDRRIINILKGACIAIVQALDEELGDKYKTIPSRQERDMLHKIRSETHKLVRRLPD